MVLCTIDAQSPVGLYSISTGPRQPGVVGLGPDAAALTPQHVLHCASLAKPFVATAVMQLVEEGYMLSGASLELLREQAARHRGD